MKKNKTIKTIAIAVISILIITIIGGGIYTVFIKKDDNQNNVVEKNYKTKDGKFILKVISDKKAYINDEELKISMIHEDDKYALYYCYFKKEPYSNNKYEERFLVDKEKKEIVEKPEYFQKDNVFYRFNDKGEGNLIDFLKTDAGYVFTELEVGGELADNYVIYTTSWEEIGYIDDYKSLKSDKDGIYLYRIVDRMPAFESKNLMLIKYDINGNRLDGIKEIVLTENDTKIDFAGKNINLKYNNSDLYFNNKKIATIPGGITKAYITDKVILLEKSTQCDGYVFGVINENGIYRDIDNSNSINHYFNLYIENGKIYGIPYSCESCMFECRAYEKVEFVYDGTSVKIKEIK